MEIGYNAPLGAPLPSFLRMILSENRTPLFGIMREEAKNLLRLRGEQSSGAETRVARTDFYFLSRETGEGDRAKRGGRGAPPTILRSASVGPPSPLSRGGRLKRVLPIRQRLGRFAERRGGAKAV